MTHYADSSFLVSCYVVDRNTAAAKNWLASVAVVLPFTELHSLEIRNALQLGIFRELFPGSDAKKALANLRDDLRNGRLVRQAVDWKRALRLAATLSGKHSASLGTRSLDILHVAAASALHAVEFVSFDTRQRSLATALGMRAIP